jgi:hypothetical protein
MGLDYVLRRMRANTSEPNCAAKAGELEQERKRRATAYEHVHNGKHSSPD